MVGYCHSRPTYTPDSREVAEILEPPLTLLTDESIIRHEYRDFPQIGRAKIPYFDIFGHKVWGATAMMLAEFSTIMTPHLHLNGRSR